MADSFTLPVSMYKFKNKNFRDLSMIFLDFFSRTVTSFKKKESLKNALPYSRSYRALQILYLNCMLKAEFFELICR